MSLQNENEWTTLLMNAGTINSVKATDETITFYCSKYSLKIYALGDCCSVSKFYSFDNINDLVGYTVTSVSENPTTEEWNSNRILKYEYVLVINKHGLEDLYTIYMSNESNGYYSGYISCEIPTFYNSVVPNINSECSKLQAFAPKFSADIIVGLPASGKTTFAQTLNAHKDAIFDDVRTHSVFFAKCLDAWKLHGKVVICGPNLCDKKNMERCVQFVSQHVLPQNIKIWCYANDDLQCIANDRGRPYDLNCVSNIKTATKKYDETLVYINALPYTITHMPVVKSDTAVYNYVEPFRPYTNVASYGISGCLSMDSFTCSGSSSSIFSQTNTHNILNSILNVHSTTPISLCENCTTSTTSQTIDSLEKTVLDCLAKIAELKAQMR